MDRTNDIRNGTRLEALVLDADAGARRSLRRSLEERGFAVLATGDGRRGLDLLLDVLLDLHVLVLEADLPGRDARAFADLIRRAGGERDLALVVVARDATPALRAELHSLGVDAVVERAAGADAVAAAAAEAVAARTSSRDREPPLPATPPLAERWRLSLPRWSLQLA